AIAFGYIKLLLNAHHLFHKTGIEAIARQHSQHEIPTFEVVIDPTVNKSQSICKHPLVTLDSRLIYTQKRTKLSISSLIGLADKRKSERCGHTRVGFNDIAIVPKHVFGRDVCRLIQIGDRPSLQEIQFTTLHGKFYVLIETMLVMQCIQYVTKPPNHLIGYSLVVSMDTGYFYLYRSAQIGRIQNDFLLLSDSFPYYFLMLNDIMIGFQFARHQPFTQPKYTGDQLFLSVARHRIDTKGYARCFCIYHLLDDDGYTNTWPQVIDGTIAQYTFGKYRTPDILDPGQQMILGHIQIAFVKTGKRKVPAILINGGRTYRKICSIRKYPQ